MTRSWPKVLFGRMALALVIRLLVFFMVEADSAVLYLRGIGFDLALGLFGASQSL